MTAESIGYSVSKILRRDLQRTIEQIQLYRKEEAMWIKEGTINNSAGNLALHIAGAVNHFIGAALGKSGYIRQRDKEFSLREVAREDIIRQLQAASHVVNGVLDNLTSDDYHQDFPEKIGGSNLTVNEFLIHLVSHVNYHLGQINYHRRILDLEI
ncbi:DinB family protein [Desertivirga brevis]|uniref:DinB family protein n=1 Tax=Desertivirga brevis TaxID=2810310 RepID=UPI001A973674|nr:DinB family protein [Pedobacter sp. SYSU D00873]